jgi:hypothetical protein
MAEIKMFYAKVDYDVKGDCKYLFLFCCHASTPEMVMNRIKKTTNLEPKFNQYLEILEAEEVVEQIPQWFIDYNKERYNGEGVFKDYKPYN